MHLPLPSRAFIRESSLRDGLQSLNTIVSTADKRDWIDAAYAAGLREIEVGSFVPARLLPQLADTAELVAYATQIPDLLVSVLVPNLKGAQLALQSGAHMLTVPISASHAHSMANLRKTPFEAVAEVSRIREVRDASGSKTLIEGGVGTAFGCTLQGPVAHDDVMRLVESLLAVSVDRISLADTVGWANPADSYRLFDRVVRLAGDRFWSAHFHDTRGLALANACAAIDAGVTRFDACLAGIGGCPHAPGASGNVATEDLAFMLESMGMETGLSMERLFALRHRIVHWLQHEPTYGALWRAWPLNSLCAPNPTTTTA